jgi:carboxyl-terminal processing protease
LRAFSGPVDEAVAVTFSDEEDQPHELSLLRTAPTASYIGFGNLPPMLVRYEDRLIEGGGVVVGYVRFNAFLGPLSAKYAASIDRFLSAQVSAIIVDLRGNPGGIVPFSRGIAGHLVKEKGHSLGVMKTRDMNLNLTVHPRPDAQRFDGPVAVLLDSCSASTSEILAAGLQELRRARVFGGVSAGKALPSMIEQLPNGDGLQYVMADLHTPAGVRIEGPGVQPDVLAHHSVETLLAGRDAQLEAALSWIRSGDPR